MKTLIKKERFDKVFALILAAGAVFAQNVHPEESKIRLEQELVNGKSQYIFNPKEGGKGPREITLDRNDVFIPNQIGLFLALRSTTNPAIEYLFPFVPQNNGTDPSVFPVGFKNDDAEAIYAGFLQWQIGTQMLLSSYPTEKFKKVPEVQGAFVLNSTDEAVNEGIQMQWSLDDYMELLLERITICGTREHKITVNFDASNTDYACTEGYKPYLVLMMDGYLVKSGCEHIAGENAWPEAVGQW